MSLIDDKIEFATYEMVDVTRTTGTLRCFWSMVNDNRTAVPSDYVERHIKAGIHSCIYGGIQDSLYDLTDAIHRLSRYVDPASISQYGTDERKVFDIIRKIEGMINTGEAR